MPKPHDLQKEAMSYLAMYTPTTHGLELPRDVATYLEKLGYVEWVPPIFGCSRLYSITELGRKAIIKP